jgi:hypothetical protein
MRRLKVALALSPLLFNTVLEVPVRAIRQEERHPNWKRSYSVVTACSDVILNIETPKISLSFSHTHTHTHTHTKLSEQMNSVKLQDTKVIYKIQCCMTAVNYLK